MPIRWVIRRGLDGQAAGEPLRCLMPHAIVAEPGALTVEQCVLLFLRHSEQVTGEEDTRVIVSGERVVGHIEITRERPIG